MEHTHEKFKIYGLIGKNISYSFSRNYFLKKFENEGIAAEYVNFDWQNLEAFTQMEVRSLNIGGLNVTIPYKTDIIALLDDISEEAKAIGAVNCIVITKDFKKIGHNTDSIGFEQSLTPKLLPQDKNALILGDGGAAKAVKYVLEKLKIPFQTAARNPLNDQWHFNEITTEMLADFSILINTTPLGTFPNVDDFPPIPLDGIHSHQLVYDLIYNPEKTKLLKMAEKAGARIQNGYEMLVFQAEAGWKLWQSQK